LSYNDTGLINNFIQNSKNYQKEISYLINKNKKESKIRHIKTEGNALYEKVVTNIFKNFIDPDK
jgi:hypothetical protein